MGQQGIRDHSTSPVTARSAITSPRKLKGTIKMGDTPSVARLLRGVAEDPTQPGWGGQYVRIWDGRKTVFDRLTTAADTAEVFGVVEFALPVPEGYAARILRG